MNRLKEAALLLALLCSAAYPFGGWSPLTGPPSDVGEGAGLAWGCFPLSPTKDSVYLFHGHGGTYENKFSYYDISTGSWTSLATSPVSARSDKGGALCFTPITNYERLYLLTGDDDFMYYRHNSWTNLTSSYPRPHSVGCAMTYGGTGSSGGVAVAWLYMFKGGCDSLKRFEFDISPLKMGGTDAGWTSRAGYGSAVGDGAGLAFSTYDSDYDIYGTRGGDAKGFRGYKRSSNSWTSLADAPSNIYTGGALAAYTVGSSSDTLYAFKGNGSNNFWMYRVGPNDWNYSGNPADPTWTPGTGAALAYCPKNGKVYAVRGDHTTDFAVFDPSASESDAPGSCSSPDVGDRLRHLRFGHQFVFSSDRLTGRVAEFSVYDACGRVVWRSTTSTGAASWNKPEGLASGLYLARAASGSQILSVKFVVTD